MSASSPPATSAPRSSPTQRQSRLRPSLLASAERPALLVGDRVAQYGAVEQIVRVAELLGMPVYGASYPNHDVPQRRIRSGCISSRRTLGYTEMPSPRQTCLLAVGARVFHDFFAPATGILSDGARLVHLDINQDAIGRIEPTDVGIWSDVALGLDELLRRRSARLQTFRRRPPLPRPVAPRRLAAGYAEPTGARRQAMHGDTRPMPSSSHDGRDWPKACRMT